MPASAVNDVSSTELISASRRAVPGDRIGPAKNRHSNEVNYSGSLQNTDSKYPNSTLAPSVASWR